MKTTRINLNKITSEQIDYIVSFFKKGKVIAYPTDTIYGLGCLASNIKAINKLHRMKKQTLNKPLLVLVRGLDMAKKYCYISKEQIAYLKRIWFTPASPRHFGRGKQAGQGAVTIVLKRKSPKMKKAAGGLDSLAVRLPKSDFLIKIIKHAGEPIVSTSLNKVGDKPLSSVKNLDEYFKEIMPDLAIDVGVIKGKPSRLIDVQNINDIKILRK